MGRYGRKIYGNRDVKIFVSMFDNYVGLTGYTGNFANDASQIMFPTPPGISDNNNTRFGFRQPLIMDGLGADRPPSPSSPLAGWWFSQNTGNPTAEQARTDEQVRMLAAAGVYGVELLYFPQPAHITSSPTATPPRDPWSQVLWQWALYYFASAYKSRLKYFITCVSGTASYDVNTGNANQEFLVAGTYLNLPNFAAYWAQRMLEPEYAKDPNGLPFFGLYDGVDTWTAAHQAVITAAAVAVGFAGVHYVQKNQNDAQASALNCDLGGYNDGIGVGTQHKYADQVTQDRVYWAQGTALRDKQLAVAWCNDGRVARGVGSWWTDLAAYSTWENHVRISGSFVRASRKIRNQIMTIYSGGELCECGDFFPGRQTLTLGPNGAIGRGVGLDGIRNFMFRKFPAEYPDVWHAMDLATAITRTGAGWTTANTITGGGGSNPGAYRFQEHLNTTVGDTITIAPPVPCTGIRVYGRLGAVTGCGSGNWQTDGGGATLVNQAAGSDSFNVLLYDSGPLPLALHSVKGTIVTGIRIDQFIADIAR